MQLKYYLMFFSIVIINILDKYLFIFQKDIDFKCKILIFEFYNFFILLYYKSYLNFKIDIN